MTDILSFAEAMKLAEAASTPAEIKRVLDDCTARLAEANHAIAVDSVYEIMKALTASMDRIYPRAPE